MVSNVQLLLQISPCGHRQNLILELYYNLNFKRKTLSSQSSVHSDSGAVLPIAFRPPGTGLF